MTYKLTKLRKLVLDTVKSNPAAGEDDAVLLAEVWKRQGFDQLYQQYGLEHALRHMTRSTSLIRRRQELAEAGLINVSKETLDKRTEAFNSEVDTRKSVHQLPKQAVSWLND